MSERSSPSKPSQSQMLLAAIVAMALIVVVVFVLSMKKDNPKANEKFEQDVVAPITQQVPQVNTAGLKPDTSAGNASEQNSSSELGGSSEVDTAAQQAANSAQLITPRPTEQPEPVAMATVDAPAKLMLDDSDSAVRNRIAEYMAEKSVKLFVSDDMIRRMVVFVDNTAKGTIAKKHMPVNRPTEAFMALEDDIIVTDPNSYERYTPYATMFANLSTAQIVRLYQQFQPLILEAYEEIGYEGDEFNGVLLQAIDELLDTPVPETTLPLIKNSVTYRYAYPEWEQLSDVQKQFLRMGPNNMKKVKQRLVTLQKQLAE
ncbi:hypothetical protein BGP78_02245 [Pseudoalteromonas sp. MSK9-3]|uniref:DUF3014 domain-containing protein n=1 Tax=Pseudoalteromonas sp. MSK9-3 TaxID=1897633 RepID=UPI000E6C56D7|nr:DUF3014 domain-containing protein [Pseudoalteromonas sp. MSK9-3]RJE75563.1 hypothetical protein BGP78_02245 [Pseudoalteromonas sp. MSK9-3]